jgi:hypothetical protein
MFTWLLNGPRLNILGLLLALAGILLLFKYGMPYETRTGGYIGVGWPCLYCGGYSLSDHCELGALSNDRV